MRGGRLREAHTATRRGPAGCRERLFVQTSRGKPPPTGRPGHPPQPVARRYLEPRVAENHEGSAGPRVVAFDETNPRLPLSAAPRSSAPSATPRCPPAPRRPSAGPARCRRSAEPRGERRLPPNPQPTRTHRPRLQGAEEPNERPPGAGRGKGVPRCPAPSGSAARPHCPGPGPRPGPTPPWSPPGL